MASSTDGTRSTSQPYDVARRSIANCSLMRASHMRRSVTECRAQICRPRAVSFCADRLPGEGRGGNILVVLSAVAVRV
jgi:hypothetical protein